MASGRERSWPQRQAAQVVGMAAFTFLDGAVAPAARGPRLVDSAVAL